MAFADYTSRGAVAVITLNNPPVHALSVGLRAAIADGLERATGDAAVAAVVIAGTGSAFCGTVSTREVTIGADEGIRPDTNYEAVSKIRSALPGGVIAAGNSSQFSDGASVCIVTDAKRAEKRGLNALGIFRGFQVAGCEPDEMGIGPVFAEYPL